MHLFSWNNQRVTLALSLALSLTMPLLLTRRATAQIPSNDCADPYWQHTLRCKAFPGQPPQPNFGTSPAAVAEIKDFTRVFLNNDLGIRCVDGTRPLMYVDKAVGGPSNKWIFSMQGGGSCNAHDSDGDGVFDNAQKCLDTYADPAERGEMSTAVDPPMKTLEGIHRPDPALNPVFAGYNRVRVAKCSYDRYNGRVAYEAAGGYFLNHTTPSGASVDVNLYQQGYLIMEEALQMLESGLTYTTWADNGAGRVIEQQESLPPLADAEQVIFIGHSGGAHGLFHNIDHLAALLAGSPGFMGDVRAVFDANFLESIENEAAFATDASGNPLAGDAYSAVWSGETIGNGVPFSYDGATFYTTGHLVEQYNSWNAVFDTSCVDAHAATGDDWKCRDRQHVLFNHIATPFFFREDFTDPNQEHTNGGHGHLVTWADEADWQVAPCPPDSALCPPLFTVDEHRTRLETQFQTLLDGSPSRSELATGVDPSLGGPGNFPTFYAWMPNCSVHNGAYDDASFYNTTVSYKTFTYSMREWLEHFVRVGRLNLRGWRVDGWSDSAGNVMTIDPNTCP
jgi:hypothetical protein